ncbi:MAG TPA: hypothetical protein VFG69_16430 [Nannocystaceae bacterium]|nr:hypothetical protein [Nannocystaceae bacterium]
MSRLVVGLAVLLIPGCFNPDAAGGGGPDTEGTIGSAETSAPNDTGGNESADTGNGCSGDGDCVDADPCSLDTCDAGTCKHAPNLDDPACSCTGPADCTELPADSECRTRTCVDDVCGLSFTDADTPVNETQQTAEDCRIVVCDGAGNIHSIDDDTDVPIDGLECTTDECVDGSPRNSPLRSGTSCGKAGTCDGKGACIGCSSPEDCGGETTFCEAVTCEAEVCGIALTDFGTPLPEQTDGDCQQLVCDGRGNSGSVADDTDLPPDDGNDCTSEACEDGVAVHPNLPSNTDCSGGGGSVCDGAGSCVECNSNAQCGGGDQCNVPACVNNQCTLAPDTGASCNDGFFCTQTDTCNANGTCVGSGDPCPGADGDSDCSEGCNETNNDCSGADPSGSPCNDNQFCTANDTCNGNGSCTGSGNPCPGADGDSDCSETCNEAADQCSSNDPNNTPCGPCRHCSSGTCLNECNAIAMCCPGDVCISMGQSCP